MNTKYGTDLCTWCRKIVLSVSAKKKKLKYYQKFIFRFILPLFVEATISPFMKTLFVSEHENIILMYDFASFLLQFKSPSISVRKLSEVILTKLTKNEKTKSR